MQPAQAVQPVELPPSLKNNVVVLDAPNPAAPGGVTKVYLLGMSHVSKKSVQQVKDLVRAVQPDVVGVELCRERLPLLVDPEKDSAANLLWHCRKVGEGRDSVCLGSAGAMLLLASGVNSALLPVVLPMGCRWRLRGCPRHLSGPAGTPSRGCCAPAWGAL
jgi:hypothetical protein